jgi:hypothetical protein
VSFLINTREALKQGQWSKSAYLASTVPDTHFLTAYPPADDNVRHYLCHSGHNFETVRASYIAFLRALFKEALALMIQMKPEDNIPFSQQWYQYMQDGISHDAQGPNRMAFYETVVTTAKTLVHHFPFPICLSKNDLL